MPKFSGPKTDNRYPAFVGLISNPDDSRSRNLQRRVSFPQGKELNRMAEEKEIIVRFFIARAEQTLHFILTSIGVPPFSVIGWQEARRMPLGERRIVMVTLSLSTCEAPRILPERHWPSTPPTPGRT